LVLLLTSNVSSGGFAIMEVILPFFFPFFQIVIYLFLIIHKVKHGNAGTKDIFE